MAILNSNDLVDLSTFRCRACTKSLRYPIMTIGQFGNICEHCFETTPYTDAIRNDELNSLMEKLSFACNYTKDGCTFFGSFRSTSEHEKRCMWRERLCPFAYIEKCDTSLRPIEIVKHIEECHKDDILTVEDGCISMSDTNQESLNVCRINKNYFVVRSLFKKETKHVLYTFYRLSDSNAAKAVQFRSDGFNEERRENLVMHESELRCEFDVVNAFSVDSNFDGRIKIIIGENDTTRKNIDLNQVRCKKMRFQCQQCHQLFVKVRFCSVCNSNIAICAQCRGICQKCKINTVTYLIDLNNLHNINSEFACSSPGCNEVVPAELYNTHVNYQCCFTIRRCTLCNKEYTAEDIVEHMLAMHRSVINPKMCVIVSFNTGTSYIFVNDRDVFIVICSLMNTKILALVIIKLTEPYWDTFYTWKVHMKSRETMLESITLGNCTIDGHRRLIEVSRFMVEDRLEFTAQITRI